MKIKCYDLYGDISHSMKTRTDVAEFVIKLRHGGHHIRRSSKGEFYWLGYFNRYTLRVA